MGPEERDAESSAASAVEDASGPEQGRAAPRANTSKSEADVPVDVDDPVGPVEVDEPPEPRRIRRQPDVMRLLFESLMIVVVLLLG
ncbi:MAG TPA: hypothetical protein VH372_20300, partial [Actinospica sp.]|nr:hypothetical protein [Actinospica sp.]